MSKWGGEKAGHELGNSLIRSLEKMIGGKDSRNKKGAENHKTVE